MIYFQIPQILRLLARQKNIRHLSWMKRFLERLLQIVNAPARLANVINVLQGTVANEDQAYLVITKSDLTAPIEEADKTRDNTLSGMNSALDYMRRLGTDEQKPAAERVIERVTYHKVSISDRYEDENEKIAQVVQDLKSGTLAADIATLNLTATVNLLEQQNQQVINLLKQRQGDRSTQESAVMSKARALTDAAYEDAVAVLNAFAITEFNGQSSPYDEIIRIINSDINYYSQYVFTNATATTNTNGSGTGAGSTEGSGSGEGTGTEGGSSSEGGTGSTGDSGNTGGSGDNGGTTTDPGTGGGTHFGDEG